jgi:hypothetical protein
VVLDVFEQPLDRIVGVGALIDVPWPLLHWHVWPELRKLAFGQISPPGVLVDKDEPILFKERRRSRVSG